MTLDLRRFLAHGGISDPDPLQVDHVSSTLSSSMPGPSQRDAFQIKFAQPGMPVVQPQAESIPMQTRASARWQSRRGSISEAASESSRGSRVRIAASDLGSCTALNMDSEEWDNVEEENANALLATSEKLGMSFVQPPTVR